MIEFTALHGLDIDGCIFKSRQTVGDRGHLLIYGVSPAMSLIKLWSGGLTLAYSVGLRLIVFGRFFPESLGEAHDEWQVRIVA